MAERSSNGYKEVPVRQSEESTIAEEEKDTLLEARSYSRRDRKRSRSKAVWFLIALLLLSNIGLLGGLIHYFRKTHHKEKDVPWLPPKTVGRGFVNINNDTALPDQPGLDQSLPHQRAMISVFHQLHCIYMTREGYYAAREGNLDQVNAAHLMHCWDYLRQAIMCHADTTLEWIPAPPNDKGSTGWGVEHTCGDFDAIARWAEDNRLKTTYGIH
uniref:Oxidase ustYa n=1 Tax=Aspergillus flavus (strain ATCC 200026 / FGSC A1120 / IAM 13836 / NRRL 3357 / JCM 12722 / SRRC 167) TaxID=332952 RepID=USTYA_ASPFN|nr:RecName: Full=Oxidase ustYa; AltName: Full=Ustiloxin B biosynthesis protein Ya [Aspergillus flavus NRRL3357]